MTFKKQCPYCGQHIRYDESHEDTTVQCPNCLHEIYIPRHIMEIQVNTAPIHIFSSIVLMVCVILFLTSGNLSFGQQFILFLIFLSGLFLIFEKPMH